MRTPQALPGGKYTDAVSCHGVRLSSNSLDGLSFSTRKLAVHLVLFIRARFICRRGKFFPVPIVFTSCPKARRGSRLSQDGETFPARFINKMTTEKERLVRRCVQETRRPADIGKWTEFNLFLQKLLYIALKRGKKVEAEIPS